MADDPNALIAEQFAKARKGLQTQKLQAIDELRARSGRQQALTGMSGGTALKAQSIAQRDLENQFLGAEDKLSAEEAAAKIQESQYQRGEALEKQKMAQQESQFGRELGQSESQFGRQLGQQESQFGRQLSTQQEQFTKQFGLTDKQFEESKKQFAYQYNMALKEFDENQKTNFMNTMINIQKAGGDIGRWAENMTSYYNITTGQTGGLGGASANPGFQPWNISGGSKLKPIAI